MDTLYDQCCKSQVEFFNEVFIQKLLFRNGLCIGAAGYNIKDMETRIFHSKAVVLASGGCGRIYRVTSNGFASTGDGFALALDAGNPLEDMEFIQFHPTGIYGLGILVSEAARAEGGVLRNNLGKRFMERYAPKLKDLAPRDIISRAILTEIKRGRGINGQDYVHLDLQQIGKEKLELKLPEISSLVKTYLGIDPSETSIPVAPTCHYIMGGIPTNSDGEVLADERGTITSGLYAAGECACVSVHGANRLGCNSLIDLVVFGGRVAKAATKYVESINYGELPPEAEKEVTMRIRVLIEKKGSEHVAILREKLRQVMSENCSVFRDKNGLIEALSEIQNLKKRHANLKIADKEKLFNYELQEALELENMLKISEAIVFSGLYREESRGSHFRRDFPERNDQTWLKHTFVAASKEGLTLLYKPVVISEFKPEKRRY